MISKLESEEIVKIEKRLADILCFTKKYEERDTHEEVKKVLSRYLAGLVWACKEGKLGEDSLAINIIRGKE